MKKLKWLQRACCALLGSALAITPVLLGCDNDSGGDGGNNDTTEPGKSLVVPQPSIAGNYSPAKNATSVYEDGSLMIKFDAAPTLDSTGTKTVKIYEVDETDPANPVYAEVDVIKAKGEKDYIIRNGSPKDINVDDQLVSVLGNVVVIKPHQKSTAKDSVLEAGKKYSVEIENGLVTGKVGGVDFAGVEKGSWNFTTRDDISTELAASADKKITVGKDKNFSTLQGAFNFLMSNITTEEDWTIEVDSGYYHECLSYNGSVNAKIIGKSSGQRPCVYWRNSQGLNNQQRERQIFIWKGGNLVIENMWFESTAKRSVAGDAIGGNIQSETFYFDCNADLVVYNSKFYSYQDTLLIGTSNGTPKYGGHAWFYKCEIAGDVDFIWGYSTVALFEECKIICRNDGIKKQAEIFAARTNYEEVIGKGFVLMDSEIIVESGCDAYFGRSSAGGDCQETVLNCTIKDNPINTRLWNSKNDYYDEDINGDPAVAFKSYNNRYNGQVISTEGKLAGTGDLVPRVANREYNGRWVIMNRRFNRNTLAYERAPANQIWDINSIAEEYHAPADPSVNNIFVEPVAVKKFVTTPKAGDPDVTKTFVCKDIEGNDVEGVEWSCTEVKTSDGETTIVKSLSNEGVLTVNADTAGTVTIVASKGKYSDTAYVYAIKEYIPVGSVSISGDSTDLPVYSTVELTATLEPPTAQAGKECTETELTWTTSDKSKVTFIINKKIVDEETVTTTDKKVTVLVKGNASVTATSAYGGTQDVPVAVASDAKTITSDESTFVWTPLVGGAVVGTDVQSKGVGVFNGMVVDTTPGGKMGLGVGNERMQTRNLNLYLPVTKDCDFIFDLQAYTNHTSNGLEVDGVTVTYVGQEPTEANPYEGPWTYTVKFDFESQAVDLADVPARTQKNGVDIGNVDSLTATKFAKITFLPSDCYILKITQKYNNSEGTPISYTFNPVNVADFASEEHEIDLNSNEKTYTQTTTATATFEGNDVPTTIKYSSKYPSVATVNESTGEVTAVRIGKTVITATGTAGGCLATRKTYTIVVKDTGDAYAAGYTLDMADGSIFTDSNLGGAGLNLGIVNFIPGNSNGISYNDPQHGTVFKPGNSIELKVPGNCKIRLGGCNFSGANDFPTVTANSVELASPTKDSKDRDVSNMKTAKCYHQDETTLDWVYEGEATTVTIAFATNNNYVPVIIVETESGSQSGGGNVTIDAAWDFTGNALGGTDVDGISATKNAGTGGTAPSSPIELVTNKTGSGATMAVSGTKCEWNGKLHFATGGSDANLFTITTDAACTAVIKVSSSSSSKTSGKVNALKLGATTIYDFDTVDTSADAVEKTVSLSAGVNQFSGSGVSIHTVTLSTN